MSLLDLVRPDLQGFAGYSSARKEAQGGQVFLNANESPWAPAGEAWANGLNRYPDPQPEALIAALATLYGATPEEVLVGRGSDEPIDLLTRALCVAGQDAVLICPPTFGMYAVCARVQNAAVCEVPLRATDDPQAPFALDVEGVINAARSAPVKLVYLCSPNNPTGQALPLEQIERVAEALRGRAVVVVDEAYGEFSPLASAVTLRARFPHLVVLRTLSKAYALAGARIGTLLGDPALVRVLRAIMAPYPLSQVCAQAALNALSPDGLQKARAHIDTLLAERSRLSAAIAKLSKVKRVYPSDANFLVVAFADAASVYRETLARGIVLRDVSKHAALPDCLRISVGTPEENDRLLACLESLA